MRDSTVDYLVNSGIGCILWPLCIFCVFSRSVRGLCNNPEHNLHVAVVSYSCCGKLEVLFSWVNGTCCPWRDFSSQSLSGRTRPLWNFRHVSRYSWNCVRWPQTHESGLCSPLRKLLGLHFFCLDDWNTQSNSRTLSGVMNIYLGRYEILLKNWAIHQ